MKKALLLVNFGGPRSTEEVASFLRELLLDEELLRTPLPSFLHRFLFTRIANYRARKVAKDYEEIGGHSPIYFDTEAIALFLAEHLQQEVISFHRYLPETHAETLERIEHCTAEEIVVFPFFPQFCSGTTGSAVTFFSKHLSSEQLAKLRWIHSYADHPAFIRCYKERIAALLAKEKLLEEESILLFSAHGVPRSFILKGDPYEKQCHASFNACKHFFPKATSLLAYQSKFGPGRWLTPSTQELCQNLPKGNKKALLFVPISFTSDHIETLFEVEKLYLPIVKEQGLAAFRCPSLNCSSDWMEAIIEILYPK
ncbi:MAG: ferrochelatase [Verrucomicrobiota bacterium]|nr:ferrochelatase [Verrucomicrobiota bacterium]